MSLKSISHHLTCTSCQAALRRDPPDPPREGQCSLDIGGDRDPPVRCPHLRDGESEWCTTHTEAIDARVRINGEIAGIEAEIGGINGVLTRAEAAMRDADRNLKVLRRLGIPAAELAAARVARQQLAATAAGAIAEKTALEARLAELRPAPER